MNLNDQWKGMENSRDEKLFDMLTIPAIKNLSSRNPLAILKKNLLINSVWGVLTGILYIIVLVLFPYWQLIVCFGIVVLFTCWSTAQTIVLYTKIDTPFGRSTMLEEMEHHYNSVRKWIMIQEKAWLFMYPVTIMGGCMVGGIIGSGKSIDEVIQNPVVLIAALIALVILIPCCFFLTRKMNRKSFGRYLNQLKDNIHALREGENSLH